MEVKVRERESREEEVEGVGWWWEGWVAGRVRGAMDRVSLEEEGGGSAFKWEGSRGWRNACASTAQGEVEVGERVRWSEKVGGGEGVERGMGGGMQREGRVG